MRWLVGVAVVFLIAFALRAGLVVYAATVFAVVFGLSRYFTRDGLSRLSAIRQVDDDEVEVGDSVTVRVKVLNEGRWPIPWLILDDLLSEEALKQRPPYVRVKGKRTQVRVLRGGAEAIVKYKVEFAGRGFFPLGPMVLEGGDLFGLHRRYRVLAPPKFVTVLPRVVPLLGYEIASRRPIGDVRLTHRLYEDPTRIAGVRPYEPGDPLNRIHWRATARTGRLHSKINEPSSLAGATLLLDFHLDGYPPRGEPYRSELAATTAASLANALLLINQQVGLWCNGADAAARWVGETVTELRPKDTALSEAEQFRLAARVRGEAAAKHVAADIELFGVSTRRGIEQLPQIRRLLARLEPGKSRPFPAFVTEVAPRLPRDATVLAILPLVTEMHALALGMLRRQGFAVAAVLVMPGDDGAIEGVAMLANEGIRDVRLLENEEQLPDLCQNQVRRSAIGLLT